MPRRPIILRHLASGAAGIPVVAEEQVAAGRVPATAATFFLVDPVDGTKEFVQKRGDFTVNIALVQNGVPQLGVVYAPAKSQLFAGDVQAAQAFRSNQSPEDAQAAAARLRCARESRRARTDRRRLPLASFARDRCLACAR